MNLFSPADYCETQAVLHSFYFNDENYVLFLYAKDIELHIVCDNYGNQMAITIIGRIRLTRVYNFITSCLYCKSEYKNQ